MAWCREDAAEKRGGGPSLCLTPCSVDGVERAGGDTSRHALAPTHYQIARQDTRALASCACTPQTAGATATGGLSGKADTQTQHNRVRAPRGPRRPRALQCVARHRDLVRSAPSGILRVLVPRSAARSLPFILCRSTGICTVHADCLLRAAKIDLAAVCPRGRGVRDWVGC